MFKISYSGVILLLYDDLRFFAAVTIPPTNGWCIHDALFEPLISEEENFPIDLESLYDNHTDGLGGWKK